MVFLEKSKKSIKLRTTYIIILILTVSVGASLLINVLQSKSLLEDSLRNEIYSPGFFVRNDINDMLKYFELDKFAGMHEYLNKIVKTNDKLSYCYICDEQNKIIYHSNKKKQNENLISKIPNIEIKKNKRVFISIGKHYEVILPIVFQKFVIGSIHLGVEKSIIDHAIFNLIYTTVAIFIGTLLLSILLMSTFLTKSVISPIFQLSSEMKDMTVKMKFDKTVEVVGEDEIAELAKDFNILINEVNRYGENLEGLVRDRTLELEIEKNNLDKERTFSNSLVENSPFGIQVLDINGSIVYINPASEKIFGYQKDDVIGENWMHNGNVNINIWQDSFNKAVQGNTLSRENVKFISKVSGLELLLNIVFTPVANKDKEVINVLVMYYDNTEKALAEKKLKTLFDELQEKDRIISHDLNMAKTIQRTVLSKGIDDEIEDINISIHFEPMIEVGGDIYDIYKRSKNNFRIFIADATGHGVQAALTTMIIKSEYDRVKVKGLTPDIILQKLNNSYYNEYKELYSYFTCELIDININDKTILYSSGGHPDQFLISENNLITLKAGGKLMGVKKDADFVLREMTFKQNDKLVLFTDGLFEEFSSKKGKLSEEDTEKIIKKYMHNDIKIFVEKVVSEIKDWINNEKLSDDLTLLGIQF